MGSPIPVKFGDAGLGGIEAVMAGYDSESGTQEVGEETTTTAQGAVSEKMAQEVSDSATMISQVDNTQDNIEITPSSAVESDFYEQSDMANLASLVNTNTSDSTDNFPDLSTG